MFKKEAILLCSYLLLFINNFSPTTPLKAFFIYWLGGKWFLEISLIYILVLTFLYPKFAKILYKLINIFLTIILKLILFLLRVPFLLFIKISTKFKKYKEANTKWKKEEL